MRAAGGAPRELGLQFRGIQEHETGELVRRRGGEDRTAETRGHQMRDEAAVVEVRVREEQRVDLARVVGE